MPGFATFEPQPAPLSSNAVPVLVYRATGGATDGGPVADPGPAGDEPPPEGDPEGGSGQVTLQLMPNIRLLSVERLLGAHPGQARFRYVFDQNGPFADPDFPTLPEQVLDPKADGRYVVSTDDRLLAFAYPDGEDPEILFDGFAQVPTSRIDGGRQSVEIIAMGAPVRCWDSPIWGRYERQGDDPTNPKSNRLVYSAVHFNPGGHACMTDASADAVLGDGSPGGPVFLDPLICKARGIGRVCTLAMAVHYLLQEYNGEEYVKNPDLAKLDNDILDGLIPISDFGFMDPEDFGSFQALPIPIKDYDATGIEWPVALETVLTSLGFNFRFVCTSNGDDSLPTWTLVVFRMADDDEKSYQQLMLQAVGSNLDPALTNILDMRISADTTQLANSYTIESAPNRYEISAVLAPEFIPIPDDANHPTNFDLTDDKSLEGGTDDNRDLDDYRTYVFDESGDGHYDFPTGAYIEGPGKGTRLAAVLADDGKDDRQYVRRRRPGRHHLITEDAAGDPRPALLLLSTDYKGKSPGVWDGTGTWYEVGESWSLLDDRLGIRLTPKSVESWNTGNKALRFGVNYISAGGIVKGVSAQAVAGETRFILMLVTVIEGDTGLTANAPKRVASPTQFTVQRYIDAKDRYRKDTVDKSSWWFEEGDEAEAPTPGDPDEPTTPVNPIKPRDDTKPAEFDAGQKRAAHEMPPVAGPVTIGRLTTAYELGDRITKIQGRNLSLQTNVAAKGEGAMYPMVVKIEINLDGKQNTTLHLYDSRGDGARYGRS